MDDIQLALSGLNLSSSHSTDETVRAVHILADASRSDHLVRIRLGSRNILEQLIAVIDSSLNDSLETVEVALRCIGNACIDNDEARQNVTGLEFSWASRCLSAAASGDLATAILTAKVLYNICLDFEPAQQQCYRHNVHVRLIDLCAIGSPDIYNEAHLLVELLFSVCRHKDTLKEVHLPLTESTLSNLLKLPGNVGTSLDAEDHGILLETCLIFLRDQHVQRALCQQGQAAVVWNLLACNEERIAGLHQKGDEDDEKLLIPLSTSLIWVLSDISALPGFGAENSSYARSWIGTVVAATIESGHSQTNPRLYSAACQVLGNRLWSRRDETDSAHLIGIRKVPEPLLLALCEAEDTELLHSAAGVMLQLCRLTPQTRNAIAECDAFQPALERLCRHDNPQIKQDGIKLLRAVGQHNPEIQNRFAELAREVVANASATPGAEIADASMDDAPS